MDKIIKAAEQLAANMTPSEAYSFYEQLVDAMQQRANQHREQTTPTPTEEHADA